MSQVHILRRVNGCILLLRHLRHLQTASVLYLIPSPSCCERLIARGKLTLCTRTSKLSPDSRILFSQSHRQISHLKRCISCCGAIPKHFSHVSEISKCISHPILLSTKRQLISWSSVSHYHCSAAVKGVGVFEEQSYRRQSLPWDKPLHMNKKQLLELLQSKVVHSDEDVFVLDKPSGLPVFGPPPEAKKLDDVNSVDDVRIKLCEKLGTPPVKSVLPLHRYQSGLVVYAKTEDVKSGILRFTKSAMSQTQLYQTFCAICIGIPKSQQFTQEEKLLLRKMNREGPTVYEPVSYRGQTAREQGLINLSVVKGEILSANRDLNCSAVLLHTNRAQYDSLEIYMANHLSPILGDHTYSSRVAFVLEVPQKIFPESAFPGAQVLPKKILNALELQKNNIPVAKLPLHLHRCHLYFRDLLQRKKQPVIVSSPFPDFFQENLVKLGLFTDHLQTRVEKLFHEVEVAPQRNLRRKKKNQMVPVFSEKEKEENNEIR